jgi:hypothetical protein
VALSIESKHHLHTQLELIMDKDAAVTMMEAIPPFNWSEVALKKDIETAIGSAIDKQTIAFQKEIHDQTKNMIKWVIGGNSLLVAAFAAIVSALVIFAK